MNGFWQSLNVFRGSGQYASGELAGRENIFDVFSSVGMHSRGTLIEPMLELRHWFQNIPSSPVSGAATSARTQNSFLGSIGLRSRLEYGGVAVYPSIGYTLGTLATTSLQGEPTHAGLTGFRAQVALRATPFGAP